MSSYTIGGLPARSEAQNVKVAVPAMVAVTRGNSFKGFKDVSRCHKEKIIAIVAVVYLIVVIFVFNRLLFQRDKLLMDTSIGDGEMTGEVGSKLIGAAVLEKTAENITEKMYRDGMEALTVALNKSTFESDASDEVHNSVSNNTLEMAAENSNPSVQQVRFLYSADPDSFGTPNYCAHIFYYPWYGTPTHDGQYYHWNHQYLPHWHKAVTNRFPKGRHKPPGDIGASFYPQLGCYSSKDHQIIQMHMKMLRQAGVGVLAVSWFPPNQHDSEGKPLDELVPLLLDMAKKYALKIALHLEPYENRTAHSVYNDIKYIHNQYGTHPAFYKVLPRAESPTALPIMYIYDSYQVPAHDWAQVFTTDGSLSLRNTPYDVVAIGLLTSDNTKMDIIKSGFDGFYTYFAIDGFTYGSTSHNWNRLSSFAMEHNLLFIPSAGPGYDDTKVRPWNSPNTKSRNGGGYYQEKMVAGMQAQTKFLSITSFNEWHEGTQIEPAIPTSLTGIIYKDYQPHRPDYYLDETRRLLGTFKCSVSF